MKPAKELPIIIEKSQEDVDQIIALVHSSNLPEGTKPFVIGCIHLNSTRIGRAKNYSIQFKATYLWQRR
ncbi:TPA: hypothetical protein ACMWW0_003246 [Legionella pneumophila]|uniref:hypothetical protein n=1 Tax=Legionella pneumophila TaxID=446 RepID=UPI000A3EA10D|nr:hypothetical protein [Legionella pneumophila]